MIFALVLWLPLVRASSLLNSNSSLIAPRSQNANTPPIQIFGLSLTPGTHFSHYTLGRSPSANLTLAPLDKDSHRLISNRHCSLYCQLTEEIGLGQLRLEVYLEDTSANGTTINGSIRLRKGERRLLNTGDEIGLVGVQNLNKGLGKKEKVRRTKRSWARSEERYLKQLTS